MVFLLFFFFLFGKMLIGFVFGFIYSSVSECNEEKFETNYMR